MGLLRINCFGIIMRGHNSTSVDETPPMVYEATEAGCSRIGSLPLVP